MFAATILSFTYSNHIYVYQERLSSMNFKLTTSTQTQLEQLFATNMATGLSPAEVKKKLETYGLNELLNSHATWFSILLRQFKSPVIYLLIIAALLSWLLGTILDAAIILVIVIINALLGFLREYQTERIATLLRQHIVMKVKVLREGKTQSIESKYLVPGDLVLLQAGDLVPADIRIIKVDNLMINESVLTGESAPVQKTAIPLERAAVTIYDAHNMLFFGTSVASGAAQGIVVATGKETIFGGIGELSMRTERTSGFQIKIGKISNFLIIMLFIALLALIGLNLFFKGFKIDIVQLILFAIALSLSLIPEALPVVTTLCLSRGALTLLQDHIVVKRLSAVEDLGSMTVLCVDKTGTLTENKLSVASVQKPTKSYDPLLYALLASDENDLFAPVLKTALAPEDFEHITEYKIIKSAPFNPENRRNTVLLDHNGTTILVSRGAPEIIFDLCQLTAQERQEQEALLAKEGVSGRRGLAVAIKEQVSGDALNDLEREMHFIGIIIFEDPIKKSACKAIADIKKLGVAIKMITGDGKEVACAVAHQVGLIDIDTACAITGAEFAALTPAEQSEALKKYAVFARILPQQKYTIINLLREGNIVGFMGEGVNDTPAIKVAHVGIVVQHGSDVAKDAADIIILRKSLELIVEGIRVGRTVFTNTLKYMTITLSANIGNFLTIATASLLLDFLPLLPLQILLVNLLSDLPMLAIASDTFDTTKSNHPATYSLASLAQTALLFGAIASSFDIFFFAAFYHAMPAVLQTNWFIENIVTELMLIFSLRTQLPFYRAARPSWNLITLTLFSGLTALLLPFTIRGQELFSFVTPQWPHLMIIIVIATGCFMATELVKRLMYGPNHSS
jgi:Mg2+-importing ATPase